MTTLTTPILTVCLMASFADGANLSTLLSRIN